MVRTVKVYNLRRGTMKKYICIPCGYIYDPETGDPDSGIEPDTPFEELPADWRCLICFAAKEDFEAFEE